MRFSPGKGASKQEPRESNTCFLEKILPSSKKKSASRLVCRVGGWGADGGVSVGCEEGQSSVADFRILCSHDFLPESRHVLYWNIENCHDNYVVR